MLLILAALAQAAAATLATLDLRWLVPFDAPPAAAPTYDADTAYVPLRDGALVAVDLERGTVRWRRALATALPPASGEGLVFVAADGRVEALTSASGATRWRTPLPGRLVTVTWDTGWLLCSTEDGDFAALRASDGELVWRAALGKALVAPPAAALDRVYVALDGAEVVSLHLATGAKGWARTLSGRITGVSAVDGQLIVGTTDNAVFSLELDSGRQRWRWRVGGDASGAATSDDRHVYFVARDNVLRAVARGGGTLRWTAELSSRPLGGPQVFQGAVFVPLATSVAIFDPATGKPLATIPASGELSAAPHLRPLARPTGARLVALTRDGRLQGFGERFEAPPAPLDALPGVPVPPEER
ncbi:MAG: PQQ-binding-like beta-propeller repeat protein [Acidobacteria bacterium]|nr:PQQ-binding-like beta-propeller repeat protein [Acidobacteriota bacterium]